MAESYTWHPGRYLDASFQPDPYEYAAQQESGIRTVLPSEILNRKTPEEEDEEYKKQMAIEGAELDLQRKRLDQQVARDKQIYDTNIQKQGQEFLTEIKKLRPGDPNYSEHRSALIERMPLAIQHTAVKDSLNRLDETDKGLITTQSTRAEAEKVRTESREYERKQKDLDAARNYAAKLGNRALSQLDDMIEKNPDVSAINLIAQLADAQGEQNTVSQMRRYDMPEEDIKKFYVPEVDQNKQPTGRTVFDQESAEAYLKSYPSESNLNQALTRKMKLREAITYAATEEEKADLQGDLELTQRQIDSYRAKRGEKKEEEVPTRPTGGKTDLLFGPKKEAPKAAPKKEEPKREPVTTAPQGEERAKGSGFQPPQLSSYTLGK